LSFHTLVHELLSAFEGIWGLDEPWKLDEKVVSTTTGKELNPLSLFFLPHEAWMKTNQNTLCTRLYFVKYMPYQRKVLYDLIW